MCAFAEIGFLCFMQIVEIDEKDWYNRTVFDSP